MFPRDLEGQSLKLMDAIAALVGALDNPRVVQSIIFPMDDRHAEYRPSEFAAFGDALLWALEQQFGAAFTPELKQAWSTLHETVQNEMLNGIR